jgi:hypothetical protein
LVGFTKKWTRRLSKNTRIISQNAARGRSRVDSSPLNRAADDQPSRTRKAYAKRCFTLKSSSWVPPALQRVNTATFALHWSVKHSFIEGH